MELIIFGVYLFLATFNAGSMTTLQFQHYGIYPHVGRDNFRNYIEVLKTFRENLSFVTAHGPEAAVEKHRSRGKLLARERINLLLDPQTPFLELSSFAAFNQHKNSFPSAGIITGIAGALSMSSSEYLSNKAEGKSDLALKSAVFTGIAYIIAVVFLVAPYLIFKSPFVSLIVALFDSILIVFLFTYYISVANDQPFRKRFVEMVVLSTVVGLISFGLGYLVRIFFGIEV